MLFVRSVRVCSLVTASEKSLQRPHGRYGNLSHCISPHFLLLVFIRLPADRCFDRDICHGFHLPFVGFIRLEIEVDVDVDVDIHFDHAPFGELSLYSLMMIGGSFRIGIWFTSLSFVRARPLTS